MAAICSLFVSCQDNRLDGIPANRVYISRNGVQEMSIYDLGEPVKLAVSVAKAGYHNNPGEASLRLSESLINFWNTEYGTHYEMLPASCYEFSNATVKFGEKDLYATTPLTINVGAFSALDPEKVYALPIELYSSSFEINQEKASVLYVFEVTTAVASMSQSGKKDLILDPNKDVTSYEFDITVPFDNKWDLTCNLDVSKEAFDEFNAEQGGVYEQLPAAAVSFPESTVIPAGSQKVTVKYSIDKTKLEESNYAFVFKFASITASDPTKIIAVDPTTTFYAGTLSSAQEIVTKDWIASASSTHTVATQVAASAIDGNLSTFWQSGWSDSANAPSIEAPQWLQVDMGKSWKITSVKMANRSAGAGHQMDVFIQTSLDGQSWTKVSNSFTTEARADLQILPVTPSTARYIRYNVTRNGGNAAAFAEVTAQGGVVK